MRKRIYLLFVALWMVAPPLFAQYPSVSRSERGLLLQKKYTVAIQPMQLVCNNALRLDFEMRLGNGPGWLQFSPSAYYADKGNNRYYYNGEYYYRDYNNHGFRESFSILKGGGMEVNYKSFINPIRSLYMAYGLSYNYFDISYYGGRERWTDYIEDGLPYHQYDYIYGYIHQYINRISANCYFGYQVPSQWKFLFDMFVGLSYRHSFSDKSKDAFNAYPFSYGYTGFVWMTGVRFGIGIK